MLLFSQYVETRYASRLLAGDARGVGYLLKDRVADVRDFVEPGAGWPAAPRCWTPRSSRSSWAPPGRTSTWSAPAREREVLGLMAQGRSQRGDPQSCCASVRRCREERRGIFTKLDLPQDAADHRRVLAVLRHLGV